MLQIYDGNNFVRLHLESGGSSIGQIFHRHANPTVPAIWVWDGRGGNKRRRDKFPDYKKKRLKPQEDMYQAIMVLKEAMINYSGVHNICMDGYEGDDVIYSLCEIYRDKTPIHIFSNDKDLRAFYGCRPGEFTVTGNATPMLGFDKEIIPDEYIRIYKTLVGDPSDTIPGVPGFGKKAFQQANIPEILDRFERGDFRLLETDGVSLRCALWSEENSKLIQTMWEIIGFYLIDLDRLSSAMQINPFNPQAAAKQLGRFLLM